MMTLFTSLILAGALLRIAIGNNCTHDDDCTGEGFVCNTGICECGDGYFQSGISECSEVATIYGSMCSNNFHCRFLNNSRCDFEGHCRCLPGFVLMATHCIKVLGTECSEIECSLLENSVCGDKNTCVCKEDFPEINNVCSALLCHNVLSSLPDLPGRFSSYNRSLGDSLFSDNLLVEGWYRTHDHYIPTVGIGKTFNSCSTGYPIVVSGSDPEYFVDLTEVEKSLVAVVVGNTYSSEEIEIKVRRCPDGFHYYLKPPKTRPAVYCFVSNHTGRIAQNKGGSLFTWVRAHLRFYQEQTEEGLKDIPFAVWVCSFNKTKIYSNAFIGTVWYVNERLIQAKGPIIKGTTDEDFNVYKVSELELTEFEFMASGGSIGSLLQCGITYTVPGMYGEYFMGRRSYGITLKFLVEKTISTLSENNNQGKIYLSSMLGFGLGCSTLVTSKETHCFIQLKLKQPDSLSACYLNGNTEKDDHTICHILIPVWTRFGLEQTGSTVSSTLPEDMTIYGLSSHVYYRILVMLQQVNVMTEELRTKIYIQKTERIGQQLFDTHDIPPIEKTIVPSAFPDIYYDRCFLYLNNQEIGWDIHPMGYSMSNYDSRIMNFTQEGTYLLLRSTTFIFQVHVELQNCDGFKLCLCGVIIQYRQDIYQYHNCGGWVIDGLVYGSGESMYLYKYSNSISDSYSARFKYMTYMQAGIYVPYTYVDNYGARLGLTFEIGGKTSYEGIYQESDELQGRDGKVYKNDSDFLNTWRLTDDESLFNPANYRQYRITDEYAACGCPTSTVNITNPVVTSGREVIIGTIQCQLDHICSDVIEGEVWKPSLFPDFIIKTVAVTTMLIDSQDTSLALVFKCVFHTVDGHKYIITWFVNDVLLKESDPLPTDTAEQFTLIDEEIFKSNKVEFFLDMKIQCSVNVLDYQENVLAAPVISQAFYPFQIVSNEIALIRGRTASVSVNVNIQVCANSALCNLDIQLFDTSETHTCADSTIATIGDSGCGTSLNGLSLSSTSSDGIVAKSTITTKNNNKYNLKTFYDLQVKAVWSGTGTSIWNGFLKNTAKVTVQDTFPWQRKRCYSHVDPHFRTFDGKHYDIHIIEEFVLLRHTRDPIEIQTVVRPCYEGMHHRRVPHCSCAVTVRAGSDVFTINHCDGQHVTGFLSAEDNVLRVYSRNIKYHQIRLPTGMLVNVFVRPGFNYVMDIDIYPTPADVDSIVGLCGTFNGDTADDLTMRNGSITNNPVHFGLSWGLSNTNRVSEESLRLKRNYENQSPWKRETKRCVCQNPNSSLGGAICSANEEDTCSSPIEHKGDQLLSNTRLKRDTTYINLDFERRMRLQTQESYQPDDRVKRSLDYALSLDTAREMCKNAFNNCSLTLIEGTPVDPTQHIEECALDVAVNGTIEWFHAHCESFGLSLEQELDRDVEYTEQNPEIAVYTSQVLDCSDCSGNGECVNGTCHCNPGFGSDICLVNLSRVIEVTYIFGDGYCDISVDGSCQDFIVESDGFVPEFSARVNVKMASKDGYFRDIETHVGATTYLNFNEGIVSISGNEDQTAGSANDTVLAQQFGIAVSNNGVEFGNPKYVTVYNSRCQEISYISDDTIVVILKIDTCFIDGTCYIEDERSPLNDCLVCKSLAGSRFDWTAENCEADDPSVTVGTSVTDNVVSVYVIILIVLGILFLIGAIAVVIIMRRMCISKPAASNPSVSEQRRQQPRIYSIEDESGKPDGLDRETDIELDRLPRYVLE